MGLFIAGKLFYKAGESHGGGGGDSHNKGWFATSTELSTAYPTAEAGDWAIVGATDTVWIWDTDNSEWIDSDQKGQVTSVNGQTGDVTIADELPSQTGHSGKFLTTDGTDVSWANIPTEIPSQTGNAGKFLTTDGTDASWADATTTTVPATMPTLTVNDWSSNTQTVNVTGVTASNIVFVSPAPASASDYASAGIVCTAQGSGTLTFTCDTVPSNAITVNVVILG